jgi:hypothetical protein
MELTNNPVIEAEKPPIKIKDNSKRAKHLIYVFWAFIAVVFIATLSGYLELELLKHIQNGGLVNEDEANASDNRQMFIGLLQTAIYITTIVFFLNWFRRAYANLHRMKIKHLKHSDSWAVWSFFVPIIVFFRPVQIMNEIVSETQHQIRKMDRSYIKKEIGLWIGLWWTLFILSNFIGKYVLRTAFKTDTLEEMITGSEAVLFSDIMQIPEALLVILIVSRVTKIETKLAKEIKQNGGEVII